MNTLPNIDEQLSAIREEFFKLLKENERLVAEVANDLSAGNTISVYASCKELRENGKQADNLVNEAKNMHDNLQRWSDSMHSATEQIMLSAISRSAK